MFGAVTLARLRRTALIVLAIEARYLPVVEPGWIHLTNADVEDWESYRDGFNPADAATQLGVTGDELEAEAERLLHSAHVLDPTGDWSLLIRRARREKWKTLSGDALVSMDHRLAAELLLRFVDDLAQAGTCEPVPVMTASRSYHPLNERLTANENVALDETLSDLGISPHPRMILIVEGETEELLVPRVLRTLGFAGRPDLIRMLCMRGADKQLGLVAALAATPLLGDRLEGSYLLVRPPTRLLIAVDPDSRFRTPAKVAHERAAIITDIRRAVAAQGAVLNEDDLEDLVRIHTWSEGCFEFSHFSNVELADSLLRVHRDCGGLSRNDLISALQRHRDANEDVGRVWRAWKPEPSKRDLAETLWPVLERKVQAAMAVGDNFPPVAGVAQQAHDLAAQLQHGRFLIRAAEAEQGPTH